MPYVTEPAWFKAEGAVVDWNAIAARLKIVHKASGPPALQLRWMILPELGMPTEPFIVWRRLKETQGPIFKQLAFTQTKEEYLFGSGKVTWPEGSMSRLSIDIQSPTGGSIQAYAGSPTLGSSVQFVGVPQGNSTITVQAPEIDGLIVQEGMVITKIMGIPVDWLVQAAGWSKLEVVGMPVPKPEWDTVGKHAIPQGLMNALDTPEKAALARLQRGAPQVGWQPQLPTGETVPAWLAPTLHLLIAEVRTDVLDRLKPVLKTAVPEQQISTKTDVPVPPLENPPGNQMPGGGGTAHVSPLASMLLAAGTDPWLALALGFGTAIPVTPRTAGGTVPIPGTLEYDYMITARWEKGLNGSSAPLELAAIVPTPGPLMAVPVPANLKAQRMGYIRPAKVDEDWRCSTLTSWDRPPDIELFRPRTYAFMRASLAPVEPVRALMAKRKSNGFRDLVINGAKWDPMPDSWHELGAADRDLLIPSGSGLRKLRYGIAQQDIYGQWSHWQTTDAEVQQPDVDDVRIVSANLIAIKKPDPQDPACDGTLKLEFLWDWRIRRPERIQIVGRLYASQQHGAPPPAGAIPAVLQRALNGAGTILDVLFTGDVPSAAGANFEALSPDGASIVAFGNAQGNETRRYRVTLTDFQLNYTNTPHIGLALWARGQERIPQQRLGDWSENAFIVSASDPRPPKVEPDIVQLASLPDAAGECHARLSWNSQGQTTNGAGYYVYESTEARILDANGQPEAPPEQILSDRLTTIKNLFENGVPTRPLFTRRNDKPITANSTDVTLPRGSTSIHLYIVIGVNAGQVESAWPTSDVALNAIAAPRVMKPAPPMLEVQPYIDKSSNQPAYSARIRIEARPGPRVEKVDLFRVRVDDAAKELDTMGPAVASIKPGDAGWDIATQSDKYGTNVATIKGFDAPSGTWKRVWYRAVAWSRPDDLRGYLAGRSLPSTAAWVVVPPATPPDLSDVTISFPPGGGAPGEIILDWTSSAPLRKTPLGPHVLAVRAIVAGAPHDAEPLIDSVTPVYELSKGEPLIGSGVWLKSYSGPGPYAYAAYIRRASPNDTVQVLVTLTDPVGRTSQRTIEVPGLPDPDLNDLQVENVTNPAGTMLRWRSSAPPFANAPGPYVLKVIAYPPIGASTELQLALPAVPIDEDGPIPPGNDPLRIRRMPQAAPDGFSYYAFTRFQAGSFILRLTAPDGRVIEKTQLVS